jgi:hypothetical protein
VGILRHGLPAREGLDDVSERADDFPIFSPQTHGLERISVQEEGFRDLSLHLESTLQARPAMHAHRTQAAYFLAKTSCSSAVVRAAGLVRISFSCSLTT